MPDLDPVVFTVTTTMAEPPTAVEILMTSTSFLSSVSVEAYVPATGKEWRLVVTDVEGNTIAELENAVLSGITYELNKAETWSFVLRQNDPKCKFILDVPLRECQVWRGDQIMAWGPMVRPAVDDKYLTVNCVGALWHLGRRFIGKADRTNYLANGDFENGLAGWDFFTNQVLIAGGAPNAQPELPGATTVTYPNVSGTHSMKMENYVDGADAFASQALSWTVPSTSREGDVFTAKAYVWVESCGEKNAAYEERGLHIERFSGSELDPDPFVQATLPGAMKTLEHKFVALNESTPKSVWTRMEVELTSPLSGASEWVTIRLYAPNGVVYWDAASLTYAEKLAFYGVDQALIVKGIVEHLQDIAYGKANANITTLTPLTGVLRTRVYEHSEHPNGLAAIEEFTSLTDGLDIAMRYTPTQRILTTYYPRKGTFKAFYILISDDGNLGESDIATYTWSFDGETAANSVIVLGTGSGSDREEGFKQDTSVFSQGQTLEQVFVAAPEARIDSLDAIALERFEIAKQPISLTLRTTHPLPGAPDPIGMVWPGDDIEIHLTRHDFSAVGIYRVARMVVDPTGTVEFTLNLQRNSW
jgi:hypothetical protein